MQLPFDNLRRRRLYLVRHGESAATHKDDGLYGDEITLTSKGLSEAKAMAELLSDVLFTATYSSDIQRAQQTAEIIVGSREIKVQSSNQFTEIRGDIEPIFRSDLAPAHRQAMFAYELWNSAMPDACFFGGELYREYLVRTGETLSEIVQTTEASDILIVSHSGFQRAALCWALDAGPAGFARFEQDTCCLNILDIDVSPSGEIIRKHVRLANYTPLDPVKSVSRLTDGESLAQRFLAS